MQSLNYNIAFVYEYGQESWSTPMSLINEFTSRGHFVTRYHLTKLDNKIRPIELLYENDYDIIITLDWKGIDIPSHIHDRLKPTTFKVRECADTPQNYSNHLPHINRYNLLLTPDYESNEKYNALSTKSVWFNHFADTTIHKEYFDRDNLPPVRSTRGPGGSELMDYLYNVMPEKFVNTNGLVGENYGKFLSNGLIVLQNSRWKEITRRIFEGMACKRMVLTDRLPDNTRISELFEEEKDIVYYDGISDLIAKINYYLSKEGERDRNIIASNGHNKVLSLHTQKNRVDLILNEYIKWKESTL